MRSLNVGGMYLLESNRKSFIDLIGIVLNAIVYKDKSYGVNQDVAKFFELKVLLAEILHLYDISRLLHSICQLKNNNDTIQFSYL